GGAPETGAGAAAEGRRSGRERRTPGSRPPCAPHGRPPGLGVRVERRPAETEEWRPGRRDRAIQGGDQACGRQCRCSPCPRAGTPAERRGCRGTAGPRGGTQARAPPLSARGTPVTGSIRTAALTVTMAAAVTALTGLAGR